MQLGKYLHYKGMEVKVIGIAKHSETLEEMVVYEHLDTDKGENTVRVRPKAMFEENVIIDGKEIPRFKYIG